MATEGTVRLVGSSGPGKWPVSKDSAIFSTEDLGLHLGGQGYHGSRISGGPSRSGSAPPSMEGSRAALSFLRSHISSSNNKFGGLEEAAKALQEDQHRANPAYFAYYVANVKLNPRLPPPLTSEESHYLSHNASVVGDYFKRSSFDESSKASSLVVTRPALPTHKEEAEDEKSPRTESVDSMDQNPDAVTVQFGLSSQGRHKSLVDRIQEDFPRTPSPVYNIHSHISSHISATRAVPGTLNALNDSSLETSKSDTRSPTFEGVHTPEPSQHFIRSMSHGDASTLSEPHSPSSNKTATGYYNAKADSSRNNTNSFNSLPLGGTAGSEVDIVEREINNIRISSDDFRSQHIQQQSQHFVPNVRGSSSQAHIGQSQFIPQARYIPQTTIGHLGQGQLKFPMSEVQPVLQSTTAAITAPMYAIAAAYGASSYSNLQSSNVMSSQYGLGGYTMSTSIVSPLLPGFPSQHTAPVPVDNPANPIFGARAPGFCTGGPVIPNIDMQQFYKAYGQLGISFQPSYPDQFYVPYFQHPSTDAFAATGQYDLVTSRGSNVLLSPGGFNPQKGPMPPSYVPELQPQVPRLPGFGMGHSRKGGPANSNYYGNTPNIGVIMHYPNSPVTSPVFQGPNAAGSSFTGRRNEDVRFPFSSGRGTAHGWPGHRGREKVVDPKTFSFLEELRSNKARHYELSDISGHVVEFSADQHGSRFIQQKLETCSEEEKALVFMEILPCASALITDVFGNYVIQKFFEHGSSEQRRELANKLAGNVLSLSLQMYGCRVIQKALEVIELEQKMQLVQELDGHVMKCVRDQNGNHVIQKFIECVPTENISFIVSAFHGQVAALSTHPYGCRVIQRVLEHCTDENQSQCIIDEVLQSACVLAQNQYGNYVTQHVLERGKPHERSQIISKLAGQVVQMSQHKFASNVIEKCFQCGNSSEKEQLIEEILEQTEGNDNLLIMMKDQYANYVVQKILDISAGKQHEILLDRIKVHLQALKKYTYGKHIVARVDQLYGEDGDMPDS